MGAELIVPGDGGPLSAADMPAAPHVAAIATAQSIPVTTWTTVLWAPSANTMSTYLDGSFTALVAGAYNFGAGIYSHASTDCLIVAYLNGDEVGRSYQWPITSASAYVGRSVRMDVGDVLRFDCYLFGNTVTLNAPGSLLFIEWTGN